MRKNLLLTITLAGILSAANAGKAVLVKLDRYQWGSGSRPDGEYCIVCEDVEDGSKMKLKRCDDPYQDNTKLWTLDGKYWKSYRDPSLCVEAPSIENEEMLYLKSCDGGSKQRWTLPDVGSDGRIKPKRSDFLNVAFESIGDEPGGAGAKPGDKIILSSWADPDWIIRPVDVDDDSDDSDDDSDDSYRIGPCRQFQLEENKNFCLGVDYPIKSGRPVELTQCRKNSDIQLFCPDTFGRFHLHNRLELCLVPVRQGPGYFDLTLDRCQGYFPERFKNVSARSSHPSSDRLSMQWGTNNCVTYAGSTPREGREIVVREGCNTQWIHYSGLPPSGHCRLTKIRLRGTNLCIGSSGRFVYVDDGHTELTSCNSDEALFCRLDTGQIQAFEAYEEETQFGFWEAHNDDQLILQNPHGGSSQKIKFRSNGKIKSGIGQCLTIERSWSPQLGDNVMNTKCSAGARWDVIKVGADDDDSASSSDDDDTNTEYTVCKFKLKGSGGICAGNDRGDLKLMRCGDEMARFLWYKNGRIQSIVGGDNYWETCDTRPGDDCPILLQNPVNNGHQKFVLRSTDLVLRTNFDACVTFEGNYPNVGDELFIERCGGTQSTRWVAKCDEYRL